MARLDVVGTLKGTQFEKVATGLAKAFADAGISRVDQIHNAAVLVRTTYGADIYQVIELLKKPPKRVVVAKEAVDKE